MGTDPDDPYPPGTDCTRCWGVGKPFGDFPTPKFIKVTFTGVQQCPGPPFGSLPNGEHILTQIPGTCTWTDGSSSVGYGVGFVDVTNTDLAGPWIMFEGTGINCGTSVLNGLNLGTCGVPNLGRDGSAVIAWGEEIFL